MGLEKIEFEYGDVLEAEHVNDIQDAIINNENNLLNVNSELNKKADINQGEENANKFWKVGENGDLVLEEIDLNGAILIQDLSSEGQEGFDYYLQQDGYYLHYRWIDNQWTMINPSEYYTGGFNERIAIIEGKLDGIDANAGEISTMKTDISSLAGRIDVNEEDIDTLQDTTLQLGNTTATFDGKINEANLRLGYLEESFVGYELEYKDNYLTFYSVKGDGEDAEYTQIGASYKIVSAAEAEVSSTITITRKTENVFSTVLSNINDIEYNFTSIDSEGFPTGDATATWTINNAQVAVQTISQGDNSFPLKNYVSSAGEYNIILVVKDSLGSTKTIRWAANVIDMYIDCALNDEGVFDGDAIVRYTPYGLVEKTVYFKFNGQPYFNEVVSTSGIGRSYTIPHQEHGAYSLEIYCTAVINEQLIKSPSLYYDIMFTDEGNTTPIIRWPYSGDNLNQYTNTAFEYSVYTPNSLTSDVELLINDVVQSNLTVGQEEQTWNYRPMDYGVKKLTIKSGSTEKTKNLTVDKFPYDVDPITEGLQLDFNPSGRTNNDSGYDTFVYGNYSMTVSDNFDWNNGGWKTDVDGNSYFCVKAGSSMSINYPLFGDDARQTGKNFKLIYKATNCRTFKAPVMSCMTTKVMIDEDGKEYDFKIGVDINAQEAVAYGGSSNIEVPYVEDEIIALEFNIEADKANGGNNLMVGLIDSDPSRAINYDSNTASFNQATITDDAKPLPIVFGSDECDVWIYRFKAYNVSLTDTEVMANYIADALNADEMLERYERNNILNDATGELDYNKLANLYPELRIILLTCGEFTKDKDDKIQGCTVQQIMGNGDPKHNWVATNVQLKGQGTSSNEYGASSRNIDLKMNDGFTYSDNTWTKKYAMTNNSVGVNYFNIKVNVASSENANNALLSDDFNNFNPYIRPAKTKNPKVRDTMEFHPCVIFLQETGVNANGEAVATNQFPADGQFHFYSCGDFGNSKKNSEAFGMDENNLKECIVEISNNTQPQCLFKSDNLADSIVDDAGNTLDTWGGDVVEFRYPDAGDLLDEEVWLEDATEEISKILVAELKVSNPKAEDESDDAYEERINGLLESALVTDEVKNQISVRAAAIGSANTTHVNNLKDSAKRLWSWVYSTDSTNPTNQPLGSVVDFGEVDPLTKEPITYSADTAEYRKAKFKHEYKRYFEPKSLLFHYLFTERHLMIDNRAKNTFLHTEDGLIWDFCFDYDNDTSEGCDNVGDLKYDYGLEDTDVNASGSYVYNAAESVLWCNVRDCLQDELEAMFQDRESANAWNAERILKKYNDYQWLKPERLQMFDMRRKYLRPFTDSGIVRFLSMLNGRKTYQRQRFEQYQETYMASKYLSAVSKNSTNQISFRAYDIKSAHFPASTQFTITPYTDLYINLGIDTITLRRRAKAGVPMVIGTPSNAPLADTNVIIYSANRIQDLGDLSRFYISKIDITPAKKISRLLIGCKDEGYNNTQFNGIAANDCPLLEYVDVRNCSNLTTGADFSTCSGLKEVYSTGSNISGISFADGGLLEIAELNGVQSLTMKNLKNLSKFSMASYNLLTKAWIENCEAVDTKNLVTQCTNLSQVRLVGIKWNIGTGYALLDRILGMSGINPQGYDITEGNGDVGHRGSVLDGQVDYTTISESKLSTYNTAWPSLNITYTNVILQHLITFKDYDGSTLYSVYVDNGSVLTDPVALGIIPTPVRDSTAAYDYTYSGWDGNLIGTPIFQAATINAQYTSTLRKYTVTWFSDNTDNKVQLKSVQAEYGSEAVYDNHGLSVRQDSSYVWSIFKGWSASTGRITGDTNVYALWEIGNAQSTITDTTLLTASDVLASKKAGTINVNNDDSLITYGDRIKIDMGYRPEFTNISSIDAIEPDTYFDGSTYMETDIMLFDEDKSWTMFVDVDFNSTTDNNTLISCFSSNGDMGLKVKYSYYSPYGAIVQWGSNEATLDNSVTNRQTYRTTSVLRHTAGDNHITLYNCSIGSDEVSKIQVSKLVTTKNNQKLGFGAFKDYTGTISDYGTGVVHRCKIWWGDLGDTECRKIAIYPWETMYWDVMSGGDYATNDTETEHTTIDLISSVILERSHIPYKDTTIEGLPGGYGDTDMCAWLNNRLYNGLPITWKVVIAQPYIKYLSYNADKPDAGYADLNKKQMHVWIPSVYELTNATAWSKEWYKLEGNHKPIFTNALDTVRGYAPLKEPYNINTQSTAYIQTTDPTLDDDKTVVDGDLWVYSGSWSTTSVASWRVYRYGMWHEYTYMYTRTPDLNNTEGGGQLTRMGTSADIRYTAKNGSSYRICPCIAI